MPKIQDLIFLFFFIVLIYKNHYSWFVIAGLVSLSISIPLFSFWIFFTAERLTWYAAAFFLAAIILNLINLKKINE